MTFREKTHWVALVVMIAAFGWYFFRLHTALPHGPGNIAASGSLLTVVTIGIIVAMSIIIGVIAARSPSEAHAAADERERAIHWRGTHYAYYPIVLGVWLCIWMIFAGYSMPTLLNTLLAVVVSAELVRIGAQLYLYRRDG
ncbi:hypothetical protein [Sphingopyxis sp. 2PD]|uniref:hypothetical protein n=1 Tax=Sphingopyxis sp. 2PD TaxID=2502196 RepID=UPI0010F66481|nr:hypothetical protein [Sphingopyxis sp. 2PD]